MVSICLDGEGRIVGINPGDLTGNTGWQAVEEETLTGPTGLTAEELASALTDVNGVPRYAYRDGRAEARTAAEIAADTPEAEPTPAEQWRADVENALVELAGMITGGE
jgi:uncharacterized protein YbjT (DUF2867 family)